MNKRVQLENLEPLENWEPQIEDTENWYLSSFRKIGQLTPPHRIEDTSFSFDQSKSKDLTVSILLAFLALIFIGLGGLLFLPTTLEKAKSSGEAIAMQFSGGLLIALGILFLLVCLYFLKDAITAMKHKGVRIFFEGSKIHIFTPLLDNFAKERSNQNFTVIPKDSIQSIKYLPSLKAYGGIAPAAKAPKIEITSKSGTYNIGRYYLSSAQEELKLAQFLAFYAQKPVEFYSAVSN